jgi:excisionase family DNA binding protein
LARRAEDLDLVISRAELPVQLGELAGVLGVAALCRGREIGAEPPDGLGVFRRDLVSGGGGVAPDPVEFGLVLGAPRGQRGVAGGQLGAVVLDQAPALRPFLVQGAVAGAEGGGQGRDLVAELPGLGRGGVGEFLQDFEGLPVLITVPTAARLLGISRASAYRYVELGIIPSKRMGGRIYVLRDQLRELIEAA